MSWLLFQTVGALIAVLALMFGVAWVMKRYLRLPGLRGSDLVEVEVLGHRALQPKQSVYVLKVLNKVLVIGSGDGGMRTLSVIEDEEVLRQLTAARIQEETRFDGFTRRSRKASGSPQTFADFLSMNMRSKSARRFGGFIPFSWFGRRGN